MGQSTGRDLLLLRSYPWPLNPQTAENSGAGIRKARVVNDHAAEAPLSVVMNFRRPMWIAM
jgi:hypothetical protein